jgi:hypothetical protein
MSLFGKGLKVKSYKLKVKGYKFGYNRLNFSVLRSGIKHKYYKKPKTGLPDKKTLNLQAETLN